MAIIFDSNMFIQKSQVFATKSSKHAKRPCAPFLADFWLQEFLGGMPNGGFSTRDEMRFAY
jgi:hypothetical protein